MTADVPATLVWVSPEPPSAEQARALASWARSRGIALAAPAEIGPSSLPIDASAADEVETMLDRARDAVAARDGAAADRALAAAEAALRARPQLPQGAWLMAEVQRARSSRMHRVAPTDEAGAAKEWTRANAIDGGRVAGVGELAGAIAPAAASVVVEAPPAGVEVVFDGRPTSSGVLATHEGTHSLVLALHGLPVWASWVDVAPGSSTLHAAAPEAAPCSTGDVGRAHAAGVGAVEADEVRCASWVAALPGPRPSTVLVAECEAGRCGPLVEWQPPPPLTWVPPVESPHRRWPTWATWGLVGAGAVVVAGVVVVASGALRPAPSETRFESGGVKSQ